MERFQDRIKQWVELDNQVKILNDQAREIRNERNNVSDEIVAFVDQNNLDKAVIEISDGALKFGKTKQSSSLTLKFVKKCLRQPLTIDGVHLKSCQSDKIRLCPA